MDFVCQNEKCEKKGVTITIGVCNYRFIDGKLVANERFCPVCGKEMEEIEIEGPFDVMVGTPFGSPTKNWSKPIKSKPLY